MWCVVSIVFFFKVFDFSKFVQFNLSKTIKKYVDFGFYSAKAIHVMHAFYAHNPQLINVFIVLFDRSVNKEDTEGLLCDQSVN